MLFLFILIFVVVLKHKIDSLWWLKPSLCIPRRAFQRSFYSGEHKLWIIFSKFSITSLCKTTEIVLLALIQCSISSRLVLLCFELQAQIYCPFSINQNRLSKESKHRHGQNRLDIIYCGEKWKKIGKVQFR